MDHYAESLDLLQVRPSGLANGWDDLPEDTHVADAVVQGGLVGDGAGERRQRTGTAADPGLGAIQDCVDLAAQAATCHGASGTWTAQAATCHGASGTGPAGRVG